MQVKSSIRNYFVYFAESPSFVAELAALPKALFIVDEMVWQHHSSGCLALLKNADLIILPVHEELKSLQTVEGLYGQIMERSPKKNLNLISIGGGITQDITGFLASTLYRGITWTYVPTTLLAQTDSCIGAKTSLNFKRYKNLIGTFYPPASVFIHTPFLATQNEVDFFSGLGELVKLHLIGGEEDIQTLMAALPSLMRSERDVLSLSVKRALMIKQSYIEEDEFDAGRRNMLNYGHCFGHALETATDFAVPHGQAVVIGMLLANLVAKNRKKLLERTERLYAEKMLAPILRVDMKRLLFDDEKIIAAMQQDKKRTGMGLALVMLMDDQIMVKVDDLTTAEIHAVLAEFRGSFKQLKGL